MLGEVGFRCEYTSFGYANNDVQRAIKILYDTDADYLVTLHLDKLPAPGGVRSAGYRGRFKNGYQRAAISSASPATTARPI